MVCALGANEAQAGVFEKSFHQQADYGNGEWGAGYSYGAELVATPRALAGADQIEANAGLRAWGRLGGYEQQMFAVNAVGFSRAEGESTFDFTAYVGDSAIYTKHVAADGSPQAVLDESFSWPKTFLDRSITVMVGPIPVYLAARASGVLELDANATVSNAGLSADATPAGDAQLVADAAIGFEYCAMGYCVSAAGGVYADVTLIETRAPLLASARWGFGGDSVSGVALDYSLVGDLMLQTLDGMLGVFAEVSAVVYEDRWDLGLLDWRGFARDYRLLEETGHHCLVGTCN